jgi:hypothetical protein
MSQEKLRADILEAKRWSELVSKVEQMVDRYGAPTLIQMSETFDCGLDILHNIGDSVEGLQIVGDPKNQKILKITKS